jgi:enoyl-[acyl-carrier protein] reductase II
MLKNKVTELYNIDYPIIQAGMVWVSGAKLAAASANAGCLGVIGAGSMKLNVLKEHILKAQKLSNKSLAVNLPIMYSDAPKQIDLCLELGIKHFITSAGSPKKFTKYLKDNNATVTHVTATAELAKKCEDAGVDAIIAEGFEAGGHNGRDEITTMVLIPQVRDAVSIPVIAAGGISDGRQIAAAFALGADAVQMGTRFMMTQESSAHENYKQALIEAKPGDTRLMMKKHVPVRLLKNHFFEEVEKLETQGASKEELVALLGKGRARSGMLEGDLQYGELETGQVCGNISSLPLVKDLVKDLVDGYHQAIQIYS